MKCSGRWLCGRSQWWQRCSFESPPLSAVGLNLKQRHNSCDKSLFLSNLLQCYCPHFLTFLLHPNQWWNRSWLASSHLVVGTHSETVLLVSLQCRHYIWGTRTLIGQLPPVCRISSSWVLYLHHIAQDGTATIITGPWPGQHKAGGRDEGDHRTGGWGLWCFCWDCDGTVVRSSAALLQTTQQIEMCIVLPITDRVSVCCAELLRSLTSSV